jgi:hypothetical protein
MATNSLTLESTVSHEVPRLLQEIQEIQESTQQRNNFNTNIFDLQDLA